MKESFRWFFSVDSALDGAVLLSIAVAMLVILVLVGIEAGELVCEYFAGVR